VPGGADEAQGFSEGDPAMATAGAAGLDLPPSIQRFSEDSLAPMTIASCLGDNRPPWLRTGIGRASSFIKRS
jgi:hypothetical protein